MVELRAPADADVKLTFDAVKRAAALFPGEHAVMVRCGARSLLVGPVWQVDASPCCMAALSEFGETTLRDV